jgi:hypothetical protein
MPSREASWPTLSLPDWEKTRDTLWLWSQIVGKTRLALAPSTNHWWQVPLYISTRGLTTSPMPYGDHLFEVELDFLDHRVVGWTSEGREEFFRLEPRSVAGFYAEYRSLLRRLGVAVHLWPVSVETPTAVQLDEDTEHRSYDPEWAQRFWRALRSTAAVFRQLRSDFLGKASPIHFFWGSFDLAWSRFSGRTAPLHPGGVPNLPDRIVREAYSHEVSSAGFWPGGPQFPHPVFYSYAYPEPPGFSEWAVSPSGAYYDQTLREFLYPYEVARAAEDPSAAVLSFFRSTYELAAELGRWDRAGLERKELGAQAEATMFH